MDKARNRFTTIEAILMVAKAASPLIAIVVVERMKGPGYSASAKETFWYVTIMIMVLGQMSIWNFHQAMTYTFEKQG